MRKYTKKQRVRDVKRASKWYKENKEHRRLYMIEYRGKNTIRLKQQYDNWMLVNKDEILAKKRKYTARPDIKERKKEYDKIYFQKNKEQVREKSKKYYHNNKEKVTECNQKWKMNNKDKVRQYHRNKKKRNPELYKFLTNLRRHKLRTAEGEYTKQEWDNVKKQQNHCCVICGKSEPFEDQYYKFLTVDHIRPVTKGGSNYIRNIQGLCLSCNSKKNNKITDNIDITEKKGYTYFL